RSDDKFAIGAKRGTRDPIRVAIEQCNLLASERIPNCSSVVPRRNDDSSVVRTEFGIFHLADVTLQLGNQRPVGLPYAGRSIAAIRHNELTFAAPVPFRAVDFRVVRQRDEASRLWGCPNSNSPIPTHRYNKPAIRRSEFAGYDIT